ARRAARGETGATRSCRPRGAETAVRGGRLAVRATGWRRCTSLTATVSAAFSPVHKTVDLSDAMWYMKVAAVYNFFLVNWLFDLWQF
ncbi:unnamed protein product, partial [Urochloa humidicola]